MRHRLFRLALVAGALWPLGAPAASRTHAVQQPSTICVASTTAPRLRYVAVHFPPSSSDPVETATGRRFYEQYPLTSPPYVAAAQFYVDNVAISVMQRRWVKYGLPRTIEIGSLQYRTEYSRHPVFVEAGAGAAPDVIYLPVRQGCLFQPYQYEVKVGGVRG